MLKTKAFRERRKALKAQVDWCKMVALDYYIAGDAYMCNLWTKEAGRVQDKILMMYPRYQKPIKTRRTIFVPVTVPNREKIEVSE